MHESLCKDVRAYVDESDAKGYSSGWCYHSEFGVLPLRVSLDGKISSIQSVKRDDVVAFFNKPEISQCGWTVELGNSRRAVLEMQIEDKWMAVIVLRMLQDETLFLPYTIPSFIVVDNFYKNPDAIREFALQQTFQENPNYHKGRRCINPEFRFPGIKERFERILGARIKDWEIGRAHV